LSPLLSNLVLHHLDLFIEKIRVKMEESTKLTKPFISNPTYRKLTSEIRILNNSNFNSKMKRKLVKLRGMEKSRFYNPLATKIKYVRYADDWIIGI